MRPTISDHEVFQAILRNHPYPIAAGNYHVEDRKARTAQVALRLGITNAHAALLLHKLWRRGLVVKAQYRRSVHWHVRHGWPDEPHHAVPYEVISPPRAKATKDK